jgi:hypothetical protein
MVDPSKVPLEARQAITRKFRDFPIFKRSRAAALYNFFAAVENSIPIDVANPEAIYALHRRVVEAAERAIPALSGISDGGSSNDLRLNPAVLQEATELLEYGFPYDQVMTSYELAERGQYEVQFDPASACIRFTYASQRANDADTLMRSGEIESKVATELSPSDLRNAQEIISAIQTELIGSILFVGLDAITFPFTPKLIALAKQWTALILIAYQWELPDDAAIGSLTLADVRKFWGATSVAVGLHEMAHRVASTDKETLRPSGSMVNVKSAPQWAEVISEIGGITREAALEILSWHTFDPAISGETAVLQPFVETAPGHLCVTGIITGALDHERNLMKLLTRHPKLRPFANSIMSIKEPIALRDLAELFAASAFITESTVVVAGVTDADLVIYERSSGFVLVIQHKWLTAPESVSESSSNDERLKEGINQAVKSRDAFRNDHSLLRVALHLSSHEVISQIEGAVVSREAEQTGFLETPAVPVVLESAFVNLRNQSKSLAELWTNLNTRPDQTKAAANFDDTFVKFNLAGYCFIVPVLMKEVPLR